MVDLVTYPPVDNVLPLSNFNFVEKHELHKQLIYDVDGLSYRTNLISLRPNIEFKVTSVNQQSYAQRIGPIFLDVPFCSKNNNNDNLLLGYCKRLMPMMPPSNPTILGELKAFVQKFLIENLVPFEPMTDHKQLFESWLESNSQYNVTRKNQLRTAFSTFLISGRFLLDEEDYKVRSFIKREFYDMVKHIRFINSRSDRFKVAVGPAIHALEKKFFSLPFFLKFKDIRTLPDLVQKLEKFKVFMQTDYTSFESGFSPLYTDVVECELFRYVFQNNPILLDNILRVYYTTTSAGKIIPRTEKIIHSGRRYYCRTVGTRMSGEMWTSLGNSFSNLMNMLYICSKNNVDVDGLVEGDDGLFGLSSNIITPEMFNQLGFKITIKYERNIHMLTFCSMLVDKHILVKPSNFIRLGYSSAPKYFCSKLKIRLQLLLAKAMSLYVIGKYTPIAGPLAYKIIQHLQGITPRFQNNWYFNKHIKPLIDEETFLPVAITDEDRNLYNQKYLIDVNLQLCIEKQINDSSDITNETFDYSFLKASNLVNLSYQ